eukprot:TRINITY_DN7363_c0_g1_i1.p1 TRINITY_DN7363_c0_g1~~TRINITY_DN7363_c0_g1_i1.p1  ORF type:complete len:391 (+),score=96.25 TRINITY_DN7363_c0_g1_i1:54-1175(+)
MGNCCATQQESKMMRLHKERLAKEREERDMNGYNRGSRKQSMMGSHRRMVEMNKEAEEEERRSFYRRSSVASMRSRRDSFMSGAGMRSMSMDEGMGYGGNGGYTPKATTTTTGNNTTKPAPLCRDTVFDRDIPTKESTRVSFNDASSPQSTCNEAFSPCSTRDNKGATYQSGQDMWNLRSPMSLKSSLKTTPKKSICDDDGTDLGTSKNTIIKLSNSGDIDAEMFSTDSGTAETVATLDDIDLPESASAVGSPGFRPQEEEQVDVSKNGGLSKTKLQKNNMKYSPPPRYPGQTTPPGQEPLSQGIRVQNRVPTSPAPGDREQHTRRYSSRHSIQSNASDVSSCRGLNNFRKRRNSQFSQYSDDGSFVEEKQWL